MSKVRCEDVFLHKSVRRVESCPTGPSGAVPLREAARAPVADGNDLSPFG